MATAVARRRAVDLAATTPDLLLDGNLGSRAYPLADTHGPRSVLRAPVKCAPTPGPVDDAKDSGYGAGSGIDLMLGARVSRPQ